jgi:hypothetical protein
MGRGRPKGHSPYAYIEYKELGKLINNNPIIKVSKAWLESLKASPASSSPITNVSTLSSRTKPEEDQPKIEFNLTTFDNE